MLNQERRREILDLLHNSGRVLVRDLAKRFRTSQITIRKDLEALHDGGHLLRAHGGALLRGTAVSDDFARRKRERRGRQQENRMAQAAAQKIRPGQVIILDSSNITRAIARACASIKNLTVITNAISIPAELADSPVDVILTGGVLRGGSFSLVGPLAEESLRNLSADVVFLGGDAFDIPYGLTTTSLAEARVNLAMSESSRRVVVLCESSKFGRRSLSLVLPTSSLQEIITDTEITRRELRALRRAGLEVTVV